MRSPLRELGSEILRILPSGSRRPRAETCLGAGATTCSGLFKPQLARSNGADVAKRQQAIALKNFGLLGFLHDMIE